MTHHEGSHGEHLGHVVPMPVYMKVFGALLFLTVVTVLATWLDYGSTVNLILAMAIASVKALLVALFFMHLKYEDKATHLFALFPLILLVIMLAGIFIDNPTRYPTKPMVPAASATR